jgi:serine/threonine-protein kinase/endoribonuclease IRE1
MRPSILTVARHPCWWAKSVKLQFLIDASDAFELCDRSPDTSLLRTVEAAAVSAFPPGTNWATSLEPRLIANLKSYRTYKYGSVRDLLRIVRNKANHFREMPADLQVCRHKHFLSPSARASSLQVMLTLPLRTAAFHQGKVPVCSCV